MAQWIKALTAQQCKRDDLGSTPGTQLVGGMNQLAQVIFCPPRVVQRHGCLRAHTWKASIAQVLIRVNL